MRVEDLGEGDPELAIVGGIHGDEPCGEHAIKRLVADDPAVNQSVRLVLANEAALARNVRFVDEDLNRAFPGDPEGDTHESRLAAELIRTLRGCTVFSLHSTQSYAAPFALVDELVGPTRSLSQSLSIEAVVETAAFSVGRLIAVQEAADVIEVECGLQGSASAAANAVSLCYDFLAATGALDRSDDGVAGAGEASDAGVGGAPARREAGGGFGHAVPVFRLTRQIPKPGGADVAYAVSARNFERVAAGQAYAAVDGEQLVAEEPFYPVLLSPGGYRDVFGYAAELVGRLDAATDEPEPAGERL